MNCIKRAVFSFKYNIRKNLLLFLVYLIVALLLILAYSIRSSAIASIEEMKKNIGISVVVSKKNGNFYPGEESNFFSYDIGAEIAKLPEVKDENYISIAHADGIDVKGYFMEDSYDTFAITGTTNTEEYWNLRPGLKETFTLFKGRFLTPEDEGKPYAIVSESISNNNKLDIGDKFSVQSSLYKEVTVELEIIGIFSLGDLRNTPNYILNYNNIYTTVDVATKLNKGGIMEAEYFLNHPDDLNPFMDELSARYYAADLVFAEQSSDLIAASSSMNNLINLCNSILFSVILIAVLVLCLLVLYLMIRRFYEIGILLSMGESKFNIIFQFALENIIPMLLAITSAAIMVKVLVLPYINQWTKANLGIDSISLGNSILLIYCVGIVLSVLSSLIPALRVLKYNPKNILDEFE